MLHRVPDALASATRALCRVFAIFIEGVSYIIICHFITTPICIKMAAHQLSAELDGFLMQAEGCLVDIERSSCDGNDVAAMDGVL